jgi:hypothetical protein
MNKESFFPPSVQEEPSGFPRMRTPEQIREEELNKALTSLTDEEIDEMVESIGPEATSPDSLPDNRDDIDDYFDSITTPPASKAA